jgi:hypothetical protein
VGIVLVKKVDTPLLRTVLLARWYLLRRTVAISRQRLGHCNSFLGLKHVLRDINICVFFLVKLLKELLEAYLELLVDFSENAVKLALGQAKLLIG